MRNMENSFSASGYGRGSGYGRRRGGMPSGAPPMPYPPQPMQPPKIPTGTFKVAIACEGNGGLDDVVSPRFGRCPAFTIVTIENGAVKNVEVMPNQAVYAARGAGIAAVQALASRGVNIIAAGRFGPWASSASAQFGIQLLIVPPGMRVRDAINAHILARR